MPLPPRLAEVIRNPPRSHSPAAIWWWSGEGLDHARLRWQLARLAEGGVHNLVVINLAPSGPLFGCDPDQPAFFSDDWWALFEAVCDDAAELGVALWFYDQLGFSGADIQARLVEENPEFAGQWLHRASSIADGAAEVRCPAGAEAVAAAIQPVGADGQPAGPTRPFPLDGPRARFTGSGRHRLTLFHATRQGFDYLSETACSALIDRVHGEFERRLGHRFGKVIAGSFQDELPAMPTWGTGFAARFQRLHGYDLRPHLAALWDTDLATPAPYQVRRDFHATRADLAEQAFFRPLAGWHNRHGLLHGCDQQSPARTGRPVAGVQLYADYARTHRHFGAPGSDHHGDARLHSSLAHLYGRDRTWIEAFHSTGWGGTLEETFDWLLPWLRCGATLYNPHAVYYSTKSGWWEWAPPATDWRQPYWRHYHVFAGAVTRLCAALSLGRHVCDVALLLPTATAQAGTRIDGVDLEAKQAEHVYRQIIGDMVWYRTSPGALDQARIDADVIDDASIQRATVRDGRLRIAGEAYAAVVLPAATVLEGATARRLAEFAEAGGVVVAVGAAPRHGVGDPDAQSAVDRLRPRLVPTPGDLGDALGGRPPSVTAPVPALVREVDGATVVFLTAASPRASEVRVPEAQKREASDFGWAHARCDFDPARYARQMAVSVAGVGGPALLVEPFSGEVRELPATRDGDTVHLTVPFDDGPAALLVFPGSPTTSAPLAPNTLTANTPTANTTTPPTELDLPGPWSVELIPTLDNRWNDFAPDQQRPPTVDCWTLLHRLDGEKNWQPAHATYGPHGLGPDGPVHWSTSRGIHKDPIHRATLGPKGHVPAEFLDFGQVKAGQQVTFRTTLAIPDNLSTSPVFLAVGAAAAKTVTLDGTQLPLDDRGYLATGPFTATPGRRLLRIRFTPAEDVRLRAHFAVIRDVDRYLCPEWLTIDAPRRPGAHVEFRTTFASPAAPGPAAIQVAMLTSCTVEVNGVEIGSHGGFEPYANRPEPRTRRYDMTPALQDGDNAVVIHLTEGLITPPRILVDSTPGGPVSGPGWTALRAGTPIPPVVSRHQHGDPAALHLRRRPHPLPAATWLDQPPPTGGTVIPLRCDPPGTPTHRVEWLRLAIPPGATRMELPLHGQATVLVDGAELATTDGPTTIALPAGAHTADLRIRTAPGHRGGAALTGPARFTTGPGTAPLGDWQDIGLADYSGGVRYRCRADIPLPATARALLDLGRVRGTAEVSVNGRPAGIRVCSPYTFDITSALRPGPNEFEITVYNTLAPYLDAVSPTHFVFPGQKSSGLFGPVRLRW